jgi:hypothetical protein
MSQSDLWTLVFVAGVAALLGYGVAKDVLDVGQATLVMAGLLVLVVLSASMATPSPLPSLILETEPEPDPETDGERFPIGFQPPTR